VSFLRTVLARLSAPFRWPRWRLLVIGGLLAASVILLATGMVGLLLADESDPAAADRVSQDPFRNRLDTPTATPISTPPRAVRLSPA
jgi:hypothetical protein